MSLPFNVLDVINLALVERLRLPVSLQLALWPIYHESISTPISTSFPLINQEDTQGIELTPKQPDTQSPHPSPAAAA